MKEKKIVENNDEQLRTIATIIDEFDRFSKRTALITFTTSGSTTLTYAALADNVKGLAKGLSDKGLNKGDRVILCAANSDAWIISCLATIYLGAIAVPVDAQQNDEVLQHILHDTGAAWVFTDEKGAHRFHKLAQHADLHIIRLDQDTGASSWKKLVSQVDEIKTKIYADDTAIIFYTSGTTGMPKGVPLNHSNILMQLDSVVAKIKLLKPTDRLLLPLPLFHVYPLNIGLLGPLRLGLPIILPQSLTGPEIMRAIHEGQATVIIGVPRLLRSLYEAIGNRLHNNAAVGTIFDITVGVCKTIDRASGLNLGKIIFWPLRQKFAPTLKLLACGGGLLEAGLAADLRGIGFDVVVGYGLTETAPLLSVRMPSNSDLASVGQAIPNVEIKIVPLPADGNGSKKSKAGEVLAKGPNVFSAYRHLRLKSKEAFSKDGWFKTGDLGYFQGKNLHITGRASSTIVMEGGEKIQPDDIEDKLAKQPGIKEIGLLQIEHKLVALVVPDLNQLGKDGTKEAIADALKQASSGVASYLKITDFAITRQPLARTNLGKIKRPELIESYKKTKAAEGNNGGEKSTSATTEISSEDKSLLQEPAAKACWDWLEKRFPEQKISLDMSPQLELNIDSLEWMNLTLELAEQTGVELSEESISRIGTVRDLLKEIVSGAQSGKHADSPIKRPLLFLDDDKKKLLQPLNKWQYGLVCFFYGLVLMLMRPFAVKAIGYNKLPNSQLIFTPNHASYMDPFALAAIIPFARLRNTFWAGWTGIAFGNPIFSFLSRLSQVFPIDAKNSLIVSLALAAEVLKENKSLIWFPEGERTKTDELLEFKQGIGLLLEDSSVLVVPVYLDGTREALPPGAFWPHCNKIKVIFGNPVKPAQLVKEGKGKTASEKIANALHDRVEALGAGSSHKQRKQVARTN